MAAASRWMRPCASRPMIGKGSNGCCATAPARRWRQGTCSGWTSATSNCATTCPNPWRTALRIWYCRHWSCSSASAPSSHPRVSTATATSVRDLPPRVPPLRRRDGDHLLHHRGIHRAGDSHPHRRAERSTANLSLPLTAGVGNARPNGRIRSDPSGSGVRLRPERKLVTQSAPHPSPKQSRVGAPPPCAESGADRSIRHGGFAEPVIRRLRR